MMETCRPPCKQARNLSSLRIKFNYRVGYEEVQRKKFNDWRIPSEGQTCTENKIGGGVEIGDGVCGMIGNWAGKVKSRLAALWLSLRYRGPWFRYSMYTFDMRMIFRYDFRM
jgi:hypothetical protein